MRLKKGAIRAIMSEEHKTLKSHFPTPIIGIVTRYDDNYGACLQAAALQQKLLQLGYSAEIIRFAKDSGQHSQSVALRYIKTLLSINLKKAFFYY